MAFPIVMSRNKLSMFNVASQVRAGRASLGEFGTDWSDVEALLEPQDHVSKSSVNPPVDSGMWYDAEPSNHVALASGNPYTYSADEDSVVYGTPAASVNYREATGNAGTSNFTEDIGKVFSSIFKGFTGGMTTQAQPRVLVRPRTSNTLWWVLGGVAVVGGAGLLIAVAKKK